MKYLAQGLSKNLSLVDLDLSNKVGSPKEHNHIGEKGAEFLSQVLETNQFLAFLSLAGNRIGDKGIQTLLGSV